MSYETSQPIEEFDPVTFDSFDTKDEIDNNREHLTENIPGKLKSRFSEGLFTISWTLK